MYGEGPIRTEIQVHKHNGEQTQTNKQTVLRSNTDLFQPPFLLSLKNVQPPFIKAIDKLRKAQGNMSSMKTKRKNRDEMRETDLFIFGRSWVGDLW
jgi:hypothetical protein